MGFALEDVIRLLAALGAGALIGLERELHDKPAGLRTNTLICLGAAVFTLLSLRIAQAAGIADTRIAAQIVSGIGFLGAGAIIHGRNHVTGLTTAATVWAVAAIGMAFGSGQFAIGIVATLLVHGVLLVLTRVQSIVDRRWSSVTLEIRFERTTESTEALRKKIGELKLRCEQWHVAKEGDELVVATIVTGSARHMEDLYVELVADPRVRAFSRL